MLLSDPPPGFPRCAVYSLYFYFNSPTDNLTSRSPLVLSEVLDDVLNTIDPQVIPMRNGSLFVNAAHSPGCLTLGSFSLFPLLMLFETPPMTRFMLLKLGLTILQLFWLTYNGNAFL